MTDVRSVWRVTLAYAAITWLLAYPLSLHPATTVLSASPDTNLFLWTLSWDTHAFVHQPFHIFDANIYYPERHTLAYSENLIGSAFFAAPILWITGNPVLAMNLVALLSAVLCGVGAFVLARALGLREPSAFLAGLVFAFSPPRFFRLDQLHLTTIEWIPFTLAFLHSYLDTGRRRDLRLAIGFFTLQALTSGHGAALLVLAIALLFAVRVLAGDPIAPAARARDVGLAGLLLATPAALLFLPYRAVQVEMGLRRSLEDWSTNAASFLASPSHVHSGVLSLVHSRANEIADAYLFPGYLPLLLAIVALVSMVGRSASGRGRPGLTPLTYLLVTVISVWIAAGPAAGLWPKVYWLPGLDFIRVPSRFMLLAVLGIAVLAAIGFERLTRARTLRWTWAAALVVGGLFVAECAAVPLGVDPLTIEIPAIDRWLDTRPKPFAIAEVPAVDPANMGRRERRHTLYMLHSMAHWQKTVEGYSGLRPPLHEQLYAELLTFPDERSVDHLRQLGVRYVVVHTDYYEPGEWVSVEARLRAFTGSLTLEHEEGGGRVYQLR